MKKIALLLSICIAMAVQGWAQIPTMCTGSRKNINDFSASERLELRNLIFDWLRTDIDPAFPNGPQRYPLIYQHTMHTSMIHGTGNVIFLTWHRYYLQELEHWLTDNGHNKYVPLPSWNPQTPIPNEFFNNDATGSALIDAGFPNLANKTITPPSISNLLTPAACSMTNINTYSSTVESPYHNSIHGLIGGSMSSITTAPGAAIFWIYHAWIDDLWYCYQKNCKSLGSDLYVKKYDTDEGNTPVAPGITLWTAPDIWVRNNPDGFQNQVSENLTPAPGGAGVAYVYVKVHNKGASPYIDQTGNISVYWAQGSVGVSWPDPWTGGTTISCSGVPRPLGGFISGTPLRRVNENFLNTVHMGGMPPTLEKDYYIYEFQWTGMPDPDRYVGCFPEDWQQQHFCILARMNDGNGTPTGPNISANMQASNNIAMRNITILKDGMLIMAAGILWGNYSPSSMSKIKLAVKFESVRDAELLTKADLSLTLDNDAIDNWRRNQGASPDMLRDRNVFKIRKDGAYIEGFSLPANTIKALIVTVTPKRGQTIDRTYKFDLIQYNNGKIVSGENYIIQSRLKQRSNTTDTKTDKYDIYPNPANDAFAIMSRENAVSQMDVSIMNSIGQVVRMYKSVTQGNSISTEGLGSGIYIVLITDTESKASSSQKLIISK